MVMWSGELWALYYLEIGLLKNCDIYVSTLSAFIICNGGKWTFNHKASLQLSADGKEAENNEAYSFGKLNL